MSELFVQAALNTLAQERYQMIYGDAPMEPKLARLLALSDFAERTLARFPEWGAWLLDDTQMQMRDCPDVFDFSAPLVEEKQAWQKLRHYRLKYWLKVMWLDLVAGNEIDDSIRYVSQLSDTLVSNAYQWAYLSVEAQSGSPKDEAGNSIPMTVLGMGKLGGKELNFSSDIDLIFAYPRSVDTSGGRRSIEAQVFYTRVAQKLISALNQVTIDGQVFRVDMRLRPFGDSGPLVMSYAAMEDYYQDQGREWERYAMLKARPIGELSPYWQEFYDLIRPFVYRRYIDFSVIDSLRKMKNMIAQEVRRKGLTNNIKLGAGGIREVEFIVQALQLIRGGRETPLQTPSLLQALEELEALEIVPIEVKNRLHESYLVLRKVEQYLQAFDDKQTQTLPDNNLDCLRLSHLLQCNDYAEVERMLKVVTQHIRAEFSQVIGESPEEELDEDDSAVYAWQTGEIAQLGQCRAAQCFETWQTDLMEFKQGLSKKQAGTRGRDILDKLMPALLRELSKQNMAPALARVLSVINKVASRTAYLELLYENHGALTQLIKLCCHSAWIAEHIAKYPILLDELIDPQTLYKPLPLTAYKNEIQQAFLRIDEQDVELQMEALRQFKQTHQLKVAAADATGVLDIMKVSDHLTALAEAIIAKAVDIAWGHMVARFGAPEGATIEEKGFAVIAYGKAGGYELGYNSDLDLVFVHNRDGESQTQGDKPISSRQFYMKLAQRLMHLFNTKTLSGMLYELDTRLRPEGNSGLLAINLESFYQYQLEQAWTWEHQALVRARMVLGEPQMAARFEEIRHAILMQQRDVPKLAEDVRNMREKMRAHLNQDSDSHFDLKQGVGGMTDIEFISQFIVLRYGNQYPELCIYPDNIRILEAAKLVSVISEDECKSLVDAYCFYRDTYHYQCLNAGARCIDLTECESMRNAVSDIWHTTLSI
ncbi:bifunctional [glutamate--ammonia ligase]-adenylyl-L-tyrosine phosphorylase/[glutamate--ammonia-ligase] adenylyltransferase [Pseudoalteromonas sp. DY56-GL79]|uniref:bifunctional [glutamate--ammonia ligase]-adenylyl-L-tyrosine phosphorylase/[glutamate--ammonia-ligase] adenylyltransferase n=1 Tax=Pseudoalteromonas sp. DY56-GL79 TaxID=2967131 RepID=UPI00352AD225